MKRSDIFWLFTLFLFLGNDLVILHSSENIFKYVYNIFTGIVSEISAMEVFLMMQNQIDHTSSLIGGPYRKSSGCCCIIPLIITLFTFSFFIIVPLRVLLKASKGLGRQATH